MNSHPIDLSRARTEWMLDTDIAERDEDGTGLGIYF
jgi:hypothetical protein